MRTEDWRSLFRSFASQAYRALRYSDPEIVGVMSGKLIGFALAVTLAVAGSPEFEVASIKPVSPATPAPGRLASIRVVTTPGRLIAHNANLRDLVKGAWELEDYQVQGGPAWTLSARFDVEGKAAGTVDRGQLLLMLRAMLADRCKLAVHRDTKELAIYALVVAKNGPKFHPLSAQEAPCWPACGGSGKLNHLRVPDLAFLCTYLTRLGGDKPVIDRTGLTGKFAVDLDMERIMAAVTQEGGPPTNQRIFDATVEAIQDELGLKLVPTKAQIGVLTIDNVERPTEN